MLAATLLLLTRLLVGLLVLLARPDLASGCSFAISLVEQKSGPTMRMVSRERQFARDVYVSAACPNHGGRNLRPVQ